MEYRSLDDELARETRRTRSLHRLLAAELDVVSGRGNAALSARPGGELSARWEREVAVHRWADRALQLRAARSGLCFGRLDSDAGSEAGPDAGPGDGSPLYIGRIGLTEDDGVTALVDWRAPAARPFYCATLATPMGMARRRHFRVAGRAPDERVVDIHDDIFVAGRSDSPDSAADPALLAALGAPRGSAMRDIVSTIQAEQDAVIRLPLAGTAVIDGGPGTGKTAVALHRVAYLLYTHRDRLARRGVLVVGPSAPFLDYVGGVLPSLGESAVVFTTPGRLRHGVEATAPDAPDVARIKGDLAMCAVLRAAVAAEQALPDEPVLIALDAATVEVDRAVAARARDLGRSSGLPHNAARMVVAEGLVTQLVERALDIVTGNALADPAGLDLDAAVEGDGYAPDPAESAAAIARDLAADLRDELVDHPGFRAVLNRLWPLRTPERLLADLLGSRDRLAAVGADLRRTERLDGGTGPDLTLLHRPDGAAWTVSDAPLLDELAELLGPLPRAADRGANGVRFARQVLENLDIDIRTVAGEDADELRAVDFVTAGMLAERFDPDLIGTVAERAAADREWTYGHLVVDEAQELSAMDWRVLARRCPSRSITVVGDLAQRSSPAGARSWADVLGPVVGDRFTHRSLTVNYRTPAEIMEEAAMVLPEEERHRVPRSVRRSGGPPRHVRVQPLALVATVRSLVADELAALAGHGTVAVISPDPGALPDLAAPGVSVHTPGSAKGLEFDVVLVVDPDAIAAACRADLYVAMTRATQRLVLVTGT